jgi:polysaccharide export outer membrane protein
MWKRFSSKSLSHSILQACLVPALLFVIGTIGVQAQVQPPADTAAPAQTSGAPTPQAPGVGVDTASSTYQLQPYDLIDVDVYSEADLHKPARLGSDGTVLLPLIGSVKVGGLTVAEATDLITKKYAAGFVKNPSVLITVLQYRKSTFSILGQIGKPGIYEIPEGATVSIVEAVSMAGGFNASAAQNAVIVKRTIDGKPTTLRVRAGDMAGDPNVTPFELLPGDTILVTQAEMQKSSFTILGQVQKPGLFQIPEGAHLTIIDAISLAGGFTPTAAQNDIAVKRMVKGNLEILSVKAKDMEEDPNLAPFEIQAGDSITVPFRSSTFSILGQVEKPGIYEVEEGTHLTIIDAILMAGGYTRLAAQNGVTVKRMVKGKLTTIKVHAGDMADEANVVPFEVLPGDIVKVPETWY